VTPNGCGGVHGGHNNDSFKTHKVKIVIIESLIADDLLKERYELNGVIFVRLWQIDILQIDYESLAFLWPVDSSLRVG
jgi:hypothetical protein